MLENTAPRSIDDFAPKTRFQFPDGSLLTVGTRRDADDPLHYGVHVVFTTETQPEPEMSILMPPHTIDILIKSLQDAANQARFIMGRKEVDYPPLPQTGKPKAKKLPSKSAKKPKA